MGLPKRPYEWFRTSVDLSPEANDIRLWLGIVRKGWDMHTVIETAIRDLGYKSGYDPDWKSNPRNQEKIQQWLEHHTGKKNHAFFQGEPKATNTQEQKQVDAEERKMEEVYA